MDSMRAIDDAIDERARPARAEVERAIALAPHDPWPRTCEVICLDASDRVDDTAVAARAAVEVHRSFRPLREMLAQVLARRGDVAGAVDALEYPEALESHETRSARGEYGLVLGDLEGCAADHERTLDAAALAEPEVRTGLYGRIAEAHCLARRHSRAVDRARQALRGIVEARARRRLGGLAPSDRTRRVSAFFERFVTRIGALADGDPAPRVELSEVPHVRQAHATFAPASLAQVLAFHGDPVDHLAIADKVCFAGTPVRRQRACAEARGHLVVEFDVTMDAARRLVDARLPFLRTTASSTASHARVTFGYDLARDCLFTRDPALPSIGEVPGDALAKQRWHGPHGLLVAPPHRRGDVDGLHLPQRDAWRLRAKLEAALERKDFEEAERTLEELGSADASASHLGHARLSIARARRDVRVEPESVEALLVLHPEAASLEVSRLDLLRTEQSQAEHAAALSARALSDDAAVLGAVAEGLRDTVARRPIAGRAALRAASIAPGWGYPLHALADLWGADDGVDERAMEAYRAATLLDEANDHFAAAYDAHANRRGAGEESLAWLRERARRALGKGVRPAIVLGEALRARALSRTRRPPWSRRRPSAPPGQRSRAPRRGRCGWRTRSLGTGGRRTRSGGSSARAARRPSRRGALRGGPRGAAGASRRRVRPAPRGVARPGRSRGDGPRARPRDALGRERRGACVRRRGLREAPLLARDGGDLLHRVARQPGHADREDRGGARAVVERCLLRRERVLARLEANDVEGAVACAEDTVRRNRGDAYGRAIRGLALGASGDRARAVDACKAALALDVDAVLAIDLLAGSRAAPAQVEGGSRS